MRSFTIILAFALMATALAQRGGWDLNERENGRGQGGQGNGRGLGRGGFNGPNGRWGFNGGNRGNNNNNNGDDDEDDDDDWSGRGQWGFNGGRGGQGGGGRGNNRGNDDDDEQGQGGFNLGRLGFGGRGNNGNGRGGFNLGNLGIQGNNGAGFSADEARKQLARAGKVVGHFVNGLRTFSSEVRDKLREQGLSDEEISSRLQNVGAELRRSKANGASAEDLLNQIQQFVNENGLNDIQRKYVNLVKQQIRSGARSAGLGDFESKVEDFINENGGVGKAISRAENNFNAAGGIDGIVDKATNIARSQGASGLEQRVRELAAQWGLGDIFERISGLYRNAIRLALSATPFGPFLNLAGGIPGLNIASSILGAIGGGAGGFAGIPGLNIAANFVPGLGGAGGAGGVGGLIRSAAGAAGAAGGLGSGLGGESGHGFLGNTLGSGLESIVRTPLDTASNAMGPFGLVPGINIARGVLGATSRALG